MKVRLEVLGDNNELILLNSFSIVFDKTLIEDLKIYIDDTVYQIVKVLIEQKIKEIEDEEDYGNF